MTSAGYYVTKNWRLSVGLSWLDSHGALQVGSEYLLQDFAAAPVAVTTELRVGQDGAVRGTLGLRAYIGPDPHKSLILRHREDDPADRSTALYAAAGGRTLQGTGGLEESTTGDEENEAEQPARDPQCDLDPPPDFILCD